MAAVVTKLAGPYRRGGGPGGTGYLISVALDSSFAAGGEAIDITDYLGYFFGGSYMGSDAAADEDMSHALSGPGRATATTSSNVLVHVYHSAGADGPHFEATGEDLSSHGALIFEIWGTNALVSSWA